MTWSLSDITKLENSEGDLEERSRDSDSTIWPIFSYSQSQTWDACEQRWHFNYREGWKTKKESFALSVGTLVHEGMDIYYGNERSAEAVEAWNRALLEEASSDQLEELSRAFYILHLYISRFAPGEDVGKKVISTELHTYAPFKTPKGRNYWLQAYIDMLVEFDFKYEVWDHKTTGTGFISEAEARMDPQTPIYCGLMREQGIYIPTATVHNQLNTYPYKNWKDVPLDKLFCRVKIVRTETEIDNTLFQFGMLVDEIIDRYQKPRMSLGRHCAKCQFFEVCTLKQKGIRIEPVLITKFEKKGN